LYTEHFSIHQYDCSFNTSRLDKALDGVNITAYFQTSNRSSVVYCETLVPGCPRILRFDTHCPTISFIFRNFSCSLWNI